MSSSDSWVVVQFFAEESIEIIPKKWMINNEYCWWPNAFSTSKLTSAIKHQFSPEKDWKKCGIKCLSQTHINNFKLASKIANQATIHSDVVTIVKTEFNRMSTELPSKRLKKSRKTYETSSSDEDACTLTLKYPKPNYSNSIVQGNEKVVSAKTLSLVETVNCNDLDQHLSLIDEDDMDVSNNISFASFQNLEFEEGDSKQSTNIIKQSVVNHDSSTLVNNSDEVVSEIKAVNNNTLIPHSTTDQTQGEFQRQMSRLLVSIELRQIEQGKMLSNIMLSLSQMKDNTNSMSWAINSTSCDQICVEMYSQLPIKNDDQLMTDITTKISNKDEILFKLAKMLTLIGGLDCKQLIRRVLQKLLTDEYATNYNYTGHKNKKTAFKKTILSNLLIQTVQMVHTTITTKEIEIVTSIWLTKAQERLKNQKD